MPKPLNEELPDMPEPIPAPDPAPNYVVVVSVVDDDEVFAVHSFQHADSQNAAKRAAIKGDADLRARIEDDRSPLMAVIPMRSWNPARPRLKPRDPVLEV